MASFENDKGYYLDDWLVLPAQGRIQRENESPVTLPPKLMAVLTCLIDHAGEVVPRDTFNEKVWTTSVVTDDALNRCIFKLRKALEDHESPHRVIETLPRRGYRLVAKVRRRDPEPAEQPRTINNLPLQRSSFIGRREDVQQIVSLLEAAPLITLTGVGGVGKTRLSLAVAEKALECGLFPDGIYFVDLSPHKDSVMVFQAVAGAIDLQTIETGMSALLDFFKGRRILLLVDNCEHLINPAAALINKILCNCPQITVLATSREPLTVDGEHLYLVPPLGFPGASQPFETAESVQLFLERAATVAPYIKLDTENKLSITNICTHLDGIPLAIELAAARTAHLSPLEIMARLGHRFKLLTGGGRLRAPRQQTLKAAVDWSYEQLNSEEQRFLARLAVFSGDFSIAAAEFICTDPEATNVNCVDLLGSLVSKSLIIVNDASTSRYRLLETIRIYAAERLDEAGETEVYQRRHCQWCVSLCNKSTFDQQMLEDDTMHTLALELDNFRTAINWAEDEQHWELAATITLSICGLWTLVSGLQAEGFRRIEAVLQYPALTPLLKSKGWAVAAMQSLATGNRIQLKKICDNAKREDMHSDHLAFLYLAEASYWNFADNSREKAQTLFSKCASLADEQGLPHLLKYTAITHFQNEVKHGNYERAIDLGKTLNSDKFAQQVSIRVGLSHAYHIIGMAEGVSRQAVLMKEFFEKETRMPFKSRFFEHLLTSHSAILNGELEQARNDLLKAGKIALATRYPFLDSECLLGFVALNIAANDPKNAKHLLKTIGTAQKNGIPFRFGSSTALYRHLEKQLKKFNFSYCDNSTTSNDSENPAALILLTLENEMKHQTMTLKN